jgi:hypothetical protein
MDTKPRAAGAGLRSVRWLVVDVALRARSSADRVRRHSHGIAALSGDDLPPAEITQRNGGRNRNASLISRRVRVAAGDRSLPAGAPRGDSRPVARRRPAARRRLQLADSRRTLWSLRPDWTCRAARALRPRGARWALWPSARRVGAQTWVAFIALRALRSGRTWIALWSLRASRSDGPCGAGGSLGARVTLVALQALGALRTLRAGRSLRPDVALWALRSRSPFACPREFDVRVTRARGRLTRLADSIDGAGARRVAGPVDLRWRCRLPGH